MVESIEKNHKPLKAARAKDGAIAIKVVGESHVQGGRHFTKANQVVSQVSLKIIVNNSRFYRRAEELLQGRNGERRLATNNKAEEGV